MATASALPALGFPPLKPLPDLEPGPWALSREAVGRWAASARAGDEIVYARGCRLLPSDGVSALQEMNDRGLVRFAGQRRIGEGDFAWLVRRTGLSPRDAPRPQLSVRTRSAETDDELAMLMAILRRLAARSLPCPTNRELGRQMGDVGPDRVAYLLGILIRESRISVEALARGLRVVTILATGARTGAGT